MWSVRSIGYDSDTSLLDLIIGARMNPIYVSTSLKENPSAGTDITRTRSPHVLLSLALFKLSTDLMLQCQSQVTFHTLLA